MKTTITPKTWLPDERGFIPAALPITTAELLAFGIPQSAIDAGEYRGELKTVGPWQLPVSYTALAVSSVWTPEDKRQFTAQRESETIYGLRTMSACHQSGYQMEGRVSLNGRKYRAFTSSQLFELETGKLVSVATVHVCL